MPAESNLDSLRKGGLRPAVLALFHTRALSLSLPTPGFPTATRVTPFCASRNLPCGDPFMPAPHHLTRVYLSASSSSSCGSQTELLADASYFSGPACLSLNPAYLSQPRFNVASSKAFSGSPFPSSLNLQRRLASLWLARAIFLILFCSYYHLPCIFSV